LYWKSYVRRVLRGGRWGWVTPPLPRGRLIVTNSPAIQYGFLYVGDIVAEYVLGQQTPTQWDLVDHHEDMANQVTWRPLIATPKDKQWVLRLAGQHDVMLTVPDPYWE
jgi:hypothetical protein